MFVADWTDALFIHFEIAPEVLQRHVPFDLDLRDGKAYVSLVAFTQRDLRPARGGSIGRWLSAPLACHEFLNVRTYVRVNGEPGIYFLAEYIPNFLATLIGPRLYGLPYHLSKLSYKIGFDHSFYNGMIESNKRLAFNAAIPEQPTAFAISGSLDEFLIERYIAFTKSGNIARRFRIRHEPWICARASVTLSDTTLLATAGDWFKHARYVGANYSPRLHDVEIGAPERISPAGMLMKWTPIAAMCLTALAMHSTLPAWGFMWAMCFALYFGCKWVTFCEALNTPKPSWPRRLGYLFAWPGMDARAFFDNARKVPTPRVAEWIRAITNIATGLILLTIIALTLLFTTFTLVYGWAAMAH